MKKRVSSILLSLFLVLTLLPVNALAAPSTDYTLTGNVANDVVAVAMAQKGKTRSDFGFSGDWCAYFACWAGRKAGADFPAKKGGPRSMAQWFINNDKGVFYCFRDENYDSLISAGVTRKDNIVQTSSDSFSPQKGDLICYLWAKDSKKYNWSHIGIVRADYTGNGLVATVEGNTGGGKGEVATFNRYYDSRIVGIIRPNYFGGEASAKPAANNVKLNLKNTSYSLKAGETAAVNFTFEGKASDISYHISDNSVCEYVSGEWKQSKHSGSLTFRAVSPEAASVTLYLQDSKGKTLAEQSVSVQVEQDNMTISANRSSLDLDLKDNSSDTVQLSWDGRISSGTKLHAEYGDREIVKGQWGTKNGNTVPVTITGLASGSTWVRFVIKDASGKDLASTTVDITVSKPSYTIDFDAYGGTGAPVPQTKGYQEVLQIPSGEPTREGFTFDGWAVSASGGAEYYPGDWYAEDEDATLYAVWTPVENPTVYDLYISAPSSVGLMAGGSEEFTVQFSGCGIDSVRLVVDAAGVNARFVDSSWKAYPGVCSATIKISATSEFQGGCVAFCLVNNELGIIESETIDIRPV